jgi:hypothetical protein
MTLATPGRSTLTTTSWPLRNRAACTWAIDADASGRSSKAAKTSVTGWPYAASISARACGPGKGGTLSCSLASSSAMSSGSRSRRVERIWPNLTKMGPRSSSVRRMRTACGGRSPRASQ